jgi:hypothetical protein
MPSVTNVEVKFVFVGFTDVFAFLKDTTPAIEKKAPIPAKTTEAETLNNKGASNPGRNNETNHMIIAKKTSSNSGGIFSSRSDTLNPK